VEIGEDTEVKTERESKIKNRYMTKNKTAEVPVVIQIQVAISAHQTRIKKVAKNKSSLKKV